MNKEKLKEIYNDLIKFEEEIDSGEWQGKPITYYQKQIDDYEMFREKINDAIYNMRKLLEIIK